MTLPAVAGNTIQASDLYQLARPSGGQETGKWHLATTIVANNDVVALYMPSQSRGQTPVSVSIDTADQAPVGGLGTMQTTDLTSSGFLIFCINGTASGNANAGGNYTISF